MNQNSHEPLSKFGSIPSDLFIYSLFLTRLTMRFRYIRWIFKEYNMKALNAVMYDWYHINNDKRLGLTLTFISLSDCITQLGILIAAIIRFCSHSVAVRIFSCSSTKTLWYFWKQMYVFRCWKEDSMFHPHVEYGNVAILKIQTAIRN